LGIKIAYGLFEKVAKTAWLLVNIAKSIKFCYYNCDNFMF